VTFKGVSNYFQADMFVYINFLAVIGYGGVQCFMSKVVCVNAKRPTSRALLLILRDLSVPLPDRSNDK